MSRTHRNPRIWTTFVVKLVGCSKVIGGALSEYTWTYFAHHIPIFPLSSPDVPREDVLSEDSPSPAAKSEQRSPTQTTDADVFTPVDKHDIRSRSHSTSASLRDGSDTGSDDGSSVCCVNLAYMMCVD